MNGLCEVCHERAWILIRKVFHIRYRMCIDCFLDVLYLLPEGLRK